MAAVHGQAGRAGPAATRIAVSGAAGTGKTTLARALAAQLRLPYVEEGMRRRLESGLDLHAISHDAHRALTGQLLEEMLHDTARAAREHGGFVCDRCPLDMAAFWLYYRFAFDLDATDAFMRRVRDSLDGFDLVVLLPLGALELHDDGVRSANPWVQLHFDALLQAMVARAAGAVRLLRVPCRCTGLDARLRLVLAHLDG